MAVNRLQELSQAIDALTQTNEHLRRELAIRHRTFGSRRQIVQLAVLAICLNSLAGYFGYQGVRHFFAVGSWLPRP
jgi:hypothetical protein